MRIPIRHTLGAACWSMAATCSAWPALALTTATPTVAEREAAMLPYYPPSALAAGIEGQATLNCARSKGGALIECTLVSENPIGQGFGQAALRIAVNTTDTLKTTCAALPASQVTFQFRPSPPSITPPVLGGPHVITCPDWKQRPTSGEVARFYPARAWAWKMTGRVLLKCVLDTEGNTTTCSVFDDPPGIGFGEGALKLAKHFKFSPLLFDGIPTAGAVRIPIEFVWGAHWVNP